MDIHFESILRIIRLHGLYRSSSRLPTSTFNALQRIDLIRPHAVKFCVESKHSCPTTSTRVFIEHVIEALRDMREICLSATKSGQQGASTSSRGEPADVPDAGAAADHSSTDGPQAVLAKARL